MSVELAAASALGVLTVVVDEPLPLLAFCWMAVFGIALAVVDVAVHRLPDRLTALLASGVAASLTVESLILGDARRLGEALAAGVGAGLFYLLFSLLTGGGIGLGDAKLALGLGAGAGWFGWPSVVLMTFLALALTGVVAAALIALRRAGRKDAIPHGPFMVLAATVTVVLASL
ncbi:prepilin peptidase [Solwaraspora sp. WMMB335]|uniref:prepilin peptidase n=1 Tax=Solwaraspora sp. WMMB335 TaxID=3404118 RepID=UPI003B926661